MKIRSGRPLSQPATLRALAGAAAMLAVAGAARANDPTRMQPMDVAPDAVCAHAAFPPKFEMVLSAYCADAPDPAAKRAELIDRINRASICFDLTKATPEQMTRILDVMQALPPGLLAEGGLRYFVASQAFTPAAQQPGVNGNGSAGQARAVHITYSFPADGVTWGDPNSGFASAPNELNARINAVFTAANHDRGRELIRQAFANYRKYTGNNYTEVADDNAAYSTSSTHVTTRGDVRIGAIPLDGSSGVLAYDYFPNGGSDMVMDAGDWPTNFASSSSTYRFLRNVVAHEHGHGNGFIHTTPCNNTKLMEPFANTNFDMLAIDDIRGAQRNYGDRFAGNNSAANATNFGDLTNKSIIERELSTNGTSGANNTDEDWFKFTLSSTQNVTISVVPTGGSYQNGQQTSGCNPTAPGTINASQAGNLTIELRDSSGASVLATAAAGGAGATETLSQPTLGAGTYCVRVVDIASSSANQTLQTYDMTIRVGATKAPPQAIAGVNKRIPVGQTCFFYGNLNSRALESGATITTYAWDLDGDGTFEVANNSQPTKVYNTAGVYNVSLRITDSNGMQDTDTIVVTAFGAASGISLSSISPTSGVAGTVVPVTINGSNLNNVSSVADVSVSGTGISITGTPVVNGGGTSITGLSFNIIAGASAGSRDVTVSTIDGSATLSGGFTVTTVAPALTSVSPNFGRQGYSVPVTLNGSNLFGVTNVIVSGIDVAVSGTPVTSPNGAQVTGLTFVVDQFANSTSGVRSVTVFTSGGNSFLANGFRVRCLADWDGNGAVDPADIAGYVNAWLADLSGSTTAADVDHNDATDPADIAVFVNEWLTAINDGCI